MKSCRGIFRKLCTNFKVFDQRISGDSEFVQELWLEFDELINKNLRLPGQRIDMVTLANKEGHNQAILPRNLSGGETSQSPLQF